MINLDESELLLQLIASMQEHISKFEFYYNKGEVAKAQEIKRFILKMQEQINEMLERAKK